MQTAIVELVVSFFKLIIKPVTGLFALLAARRMGRIEAEKKRLEEHNEAVDKASAGRIAGEHDGLRDEDYRD